MDGRTDGQTGTLGADSEAIIFPAITLLLKLARAVRFLSCNGFIYFFLLMIKMSCQSSSGLKK